MVEAPAYAYYAGEWNGPLSQDAYEALCGRASGLVSHLIGWSAVGPGDEDAVARAVCAAADSFAETGTTGGSFTIGKFSMSGGQSPDGAAMAAAREQLSATGLLFGGLR